MYYNQDTTGNLVLDAYNGVMSGAVEAKLGDRVTSWFTRDGSVELQAVGDSEFYLQESKIRPGRLVVAGRGAFFLDVGGTPFYAYEEGGRLRHAFSFAGGPAPGNFGDIPFAMFQLATAVPTTGFGLFFRSRWANGGFSGTDSRLSFGSDSGGQLMNETTYLTGGPGHWHSFTGRNSSDEDGLEPRVYWPTEQVLQPVGAGSDAAFRHANNRNQLTIGTATNWNGTQFLTDNGGEIEIEHIGFWNLPDEEDVISIAEALQEQTPDRRVVLFGDSRSENLLAHGVAQLGNKYGYNIRISGVSGEGVANTVGRMEALRLEGAKFDVVAIWAGINDHRLTNLPSAELVELIADFVKVAESDDFCNSFHVFTDTPLGDVTTHPTVPTREELEKHREFSDLVANRFAGNSFVQVIDSWSTVVSATDDAVIDPDLSNDNVHLTLPGHVAYSRVLEHLWLPILQEQFGDRTDQSAVLINEANIAERRRLREIFNDMPTIDEDGFVTVATNNDKAGYGLTAATMASLFDDADAQTQLTDFLDGLAERFDDDEDIAPTVIVQAMLMNPQIMQLITDAQAARVAAEANGTALATPNNFKADTASLQAAIDAIAALQPDNKPTVNAAGEITTSNPASGGSAHTAQDVADLLERTGGPLAEVPKFDDPQIVGNRPFTVVRGA